MRLDKFLKVSRLIKRRTVAKSACDGGLVSVNGKTAKSGCEIKEGDVITIAFGEKPLSVKVMNIVQSTKKEDADGMYEVVAQ